MVGGEDRRGSPENPADLRGAAELLRQKAAHPGAIPPQGMDEIPVEAQRGGVETQAGRHPAGADTSIGGIRLVLPTPRRRFHGVVEDRRVDEIHQSRMGGGEIPGPQGGIPVLLGGAEEQIDEGSDPRLLQILQDTGNPFEIDALLHRLQHFPIRRFQAQAEHPAPGGRQGPAEPAVLQEGGKPAEAVPLGADPTGSSQSRQEGRRDLAVGEVDEDRAVLLRQGGHLPDRPIDPQGLKRVSLRPLGAEGAPPPGTAQGGAEREDQAGGKVGEIPDKGVVVGGGGGISAGSHRILPGPGGDAVRPGGQEGQPSEPPHPRGDEPPAEADLHPGVLPAQESRQGHPGESLAQEGEGDSYLPGGALRHQLRQPPGKPGIVGILFGMRCRRD